MKFEAGLTGVRNIWCVGRNYAEHARELNNAVPTAKRNSLIVFMKPGSAVFEGGPAGGILSWPARLGEIHYEAEIVVELGVDLKPTRAAVGLDFTARDLQSELKAGGLPWTLAKSFRNSAAVGELKPISDWQRFEQNTELQFWLNGVRKQHGFMREMIFGLAQIVSFLTECFPVCPGDLIFTGTPAGVGPLKDGDRLRAEVTDLPVAEWGVRYANNS